MEIDIVIDHELYKFLDSKAIFTITYVYLILQLNYSIVAEMNVEEISGCCASVIPRLLLAFGSQPIQIQISPLVEWSSLSTTLVRITFAAASYQLSPSRFQFFIPLPSQTHGPALKKKRNSKLFHYSIKIFLIKISQKINRRNI